MKRAIGFLTAGLGLFAGALPTLAQDAVWTPDGLEHFSIYSLAAGPAGTIYAGTYDGVFRSTEPGLWTILPNSPGSASAILVDPTDPDTLYTGAFVYRQWGVHKSSDGGENFEKLTGFPVGAHSLAIDPAGGTLFVGGAHPQVYRTSDGGATWATSATANLVRQISSLVIDPTRPGTVYAGSDSGEYNYYATDYSDPPVAPVLRSTDSGAHWTPVLTQTIDTTDAVYTKALAFDARTGMLYAGTRDEVFPGSSVFRSPDAGVTWERLFIGSVGEISALVVDPGRPNTLYAGTTQAGVLRSVNGGASWTPMNDGLPNPWVGDLVVDSASGDLLVEDSNQVFRMRLDRQPSACTPGVNRLCLLENRYEVAVSAVNPRSEKAAAGLAIPGGDRFGAFSLPAFTGDPALPEVFVKMIGGTPGPPRLIFHGGVTGLPYILTVTDTTTGASEVYRNSPETPLCGGVDGSAFADASDSSSDSHPANVLGPAQPGNGTLSLLSGRFEITLSAFSSRHGRTESGVAIAKTDRYGTFSLPGFTGNAALPEVVVKMIDNTTASGKFWLFYTGLTSLDYTLTVLDTLTHRVRSYVNATPYCGSVDAFDELSPPPAATDLGGAWWGTLSLPSDCYDCPPEQVRVYLSHVGSVVTGALPTRCLGDLELNGTLDGDRLRLNWGGGRGDFVGEATPATIRLEADCDPWGYGTDHTIRLQLDRSP